MIYFTSDLHFYHENIITHTGRPFANAEKMDMALIENWNRTIQTEDEVYILGDVTMKGAGLAAKALSQLSGIKYLIRGNHDNFVNSSNFNCNLYFKWVKDYYELNYKNKKFVLCHYPMLEWNDFFRGSINLHGHQHNHKEYNYQNLKQGILRYDVGVDANYFSPVSVEDILTFFSISAY